MGTVLRDVRRLPASDLVSVRIEGSTIDRVGVPDASWPADDEVIDGRGRVALSGFVNAHTHLPMVLLRGLADDVPLHAWLTDHVWPIERRMTAEDVYVCSLLALAESIRNGVVAIADMYFHADAVARAVEASGLRAVLSYGMVAPSLAAGGREELETAERLADAWHGAGSGRIAVAISPHAVYTCGEDVWRAATRAAARRGLLVHTHVAETRHEVESWRAQTGLTPPAYLERLGALEGPVLAAHCVHLSDDDLEVLARHDVRVAHCPKSNGKLGSGIARLADLRAVGVCVAVGTDGAASNDRLDVLEETRFACLLARARGQDALALSSSAALAMATADGRRALGLSKAALEPGDPADLVLVDMRGAHAAPPHGATSTLLFAAQCGDVTDVFVDGRALLRDRRLLVIDEEWVQSEVARLAQRLRGA